jgi:hypothetical protein
MNVPSDYCTSAAQLLKIPVVEHPLPSREQLDLGSRGDEALALLEHLHGVPVRGADHGHRDLGPPVQVGVTRLGGGDIEAPPQLRHDGPHHGALLLQRAHIPEEQVNDKRSDNHGNP